MALRPHHDLRHHHRPDRHLRSDWGVQLKLAAIALLIFCIPVLPLAGAVSPGTHVIQWTQTIYSADGLAEWDGDTVVVNLTRPHTWQVQSYNVDVLFTIHVGATGSNVERTFTMSVDGATLDFCKQTISTGGALAQRFAYGGGPYCPVTVSGSEVALVGVEQTWQFENTGTANIEFLVANVQALVQETVIMDINVASAFDFWIPALVLVTLFAISYWRGLQRHGAWGVPLLLATFGIITLVLEEYGLTVGAAINMPVGFAILGVTGWLAFLYAAQGAGLKKKPKNQETDDT